MMRYLRCPQFYRWGDGSLSRSGFPKLSASSVGLRPGCCTRWREGRQKRHKTAMCFRSASNEMHLPDLEAVWRLQPRFCPPFSFFSQREDTRSLFAIQLFFYEGA
jgi:hypothetical protein